MAWLRKTMNICDDIEWVFPFFACAKLTSINASQILILPRPFRSSTNSWQCVGKLPAGPIVGTVDGKSGKADTVGLYPSMVFQYTISTGCHRAPFVDDVQVAVTIFFECWGKTNSAVQLHCVFVSSILIILHIQQLMSKFI